MSARENAIENAREKMRFQRDTVTVGEAVKRLLAHAPKPQTEWTELDQAEGRTLALDQYAASDLPPFDRAAMDGYAVRAIDTKGASVDAPIPLRVVETIAAGDVPSVALGPGEAARIMTGALIPHGADAVIMFEQTVNPGEKSASVRVKRPMSSGENISKQGEEVRAKECVLEAGEVIGPGALAILATFGYNRLSVVRKPRVGLLSTGNELVAIDKPLSPGKIRDSNTIMLASLVRKAGGEPVIFGILPDNLDQAVLLIDRMIEQTDVLVTTGGVSVGDHDIIARVLEHAGAQLLFNRVAMRPGSPTTAALHRGKLLCGLSGNPAACYAGGELLLRPLIAGMLGQNRREEREKTALLADDYLKPSPFPRYIFGKLAEEDGTLFVYPSGYDRAGMLMGLRESNCFIVIPPGGKGKRSRELVSVIPF